MGFKYIIFSNEIVEIPIIFPDLMIHDTVAISITSSKQSRSWKLVSAGFIDIFPGIHCYGESETLKIKSRGKQDSELILQYPYFHGHIE